MRWAAHRTAPTPRVDSYHPPEVRRVFCSVSRAQDRCGPKEMSEQSERPISHQPCPRLGVFFVDQTQSPGQGKAAALKFVLKLRSQKGLEFSSLHSSVDKKIISAGNNSLTMQNVEPRLIFLFELKKPGGVATYISM